SAWLLPRKKDCPDSTQFADMIDWEIILCDISAQSFYQHRVCSPRATASSFRILRKAHMNASIALILTTAVTISTIVYTFYSIQLWRTTRAAAEISRQATVGNLWAELNRYIELLRRENAPEVALLQKLSNLLLEVMITNLIAQSVSKDNQ